MGRDVIEKRPMIIAVCGVKNSGKTTLLVKLVEELTRRKIKTAVIKHDGHDFISDVPGTDSYRFHQAGAYGTAVFSDYRISVHKEGCGEQEQELIRQFPEAEVILMEGLKNSSYPKMEVIRKEISHDPVSNPAGRFLIVTDWGPEEYAESTAGFEEIDLILEKMIDMGEKDGTDTF